MKPVTLIAFIAFIGFFLLLSVNVFAYGNVTNVLINNTVGSQDTYAQSDDPTTAQGTANPTYLSIRQPCIFQVDKLYFTYLRFNLTNYVPLNANIINATLNYYQRGGAEPPYRVTVYSLNNTTSADTWTESALTWRNQPCSNISTSYYTMNNSCLRAWETSSQGGAGVRWLDADVTDVIKYSATKSNLLAEIVLAYLTQTSCVTGESDLASKEYSGGSVGAWLRINYTVGVPPPVCNNYYILTECSVVVNGYGIAECEPPSITIPSNATNITVEERTIITPYNSLSDSAYYQRFSCTPSYFLPNGICIDENKLCTDANMNPALIIQNTSYVANQIVTGYSRTTVSHDCIVSDSGFEMLGQLYVLYCSLLNQTNQTYNYKNLELTTNKPECGIFSPSLGNYTYSYGTNITINTNPSSCTFNYWQITNSTGNITTSTNNRFVLYMNDSYSVKAWFDVTTPPENEQPSEVGGGTAFPENYNNFNWSFLNVFTSGYFIAMIINLALAGMVGFATKNTNYAISTFLLFFLVFLFGGVYPAFLWIPIIAITSIIIVMMVMKIGTGE